MKKKTIAIIIAIILVLIVLWYIGYTILKANDRHIRNKALNNIVSEFIISDADFVEKYGEITSTAIYKESEYVSTGRKEVEVPCVVNTQNGKSYIVWVRYNFSSEKDIFEYVSVNELPN